MLEGVPTALDIIVQYYFSLSTCVWVKKKKSNNNNQNLFKGEGKPHCVWVENYNKKPPKTMLYYI